MKKFQEYIICIFGAALVASGVYFSKCQTTSQLEGYWHLRCFKRIFQTPISFNNCICIEYFDVDPWFLVLGKQCGLKIVLGSISMSATLLLLEFLSQ